MKCSVNFCFHEMLHIFLCCGTSQCIDHTESRTLCHWAAYKMDSCRSCPLFLSYYQFATWCHFVDSMTWWHQADSQVLYTLSLLYSAKSSKKIIQCCISIAIWHSGSVLHIWSRCVPISVLNPDQSWSLQSRFGETNVGRCLDQNGHPVQNQ